MPSYSHKSLFHLSTCDIRLQRLFKEVILRFDNTIIEGARTQDKQQRLFDLGRTKTLNSKHVKTPSQAVDAGPYIIGRGIPWPRDDTYVKDLAHFYYFAGYVISKAEQMGIAIRWGGNWDRDDNFYDQTFDDLVHYELV